MKLVRNAGTDRVIDQVRPLFRAGTRFDVVSAALSLFAYAELLPETAGMAGCRLLLPPDGSDLALLGGESDRAARNRLQTPWLAARLARWLEEKAEIRRALGPVPQGAFVIRDAAGQPLQALLGSLGFSTDGLGLTPGNPLSLI